MRALEDDERHTVLLAAMVAFYVTPWTAESPELARAQRRVLACAGDIARPTLAILRVRARTLRTR